ncbi:protease SohB [Gayadomonas joobiniege]|uniref:protease SohB n=1 Tax=Gayadomonas joobiniege TaxID=1234606 RepID=UPI000379AC4D|nr:protease SohB [Gayadomonas joobiniege]
MEFLHEYGLFLAKTATIVIAIGVVLALIAAAKKQKSSKKGELVVDNISDEFKQMKDYVNEHLLTEKQLKEKQKEAKKQAKAQNKDKTTNKDEKSRLFVIDFNGSMDAHEVEQLRHEVTGVLAAATEKDEVLVRLESGGGVVHGYGLAASQLARIRAKNIPLTVSIDKVAASGGYMMACVANKIVAAPFAIVGSIGVIAQMPNFNKLLKKHDIEFEQMTAGEFKRTLTIFGENTDKAREKFKQELEEIHQLFVEHIQTYRPQLDVNKVATGEHWMASQAKALGLLDELQTSDDYICDKLNNAEVFKFKYKQHKNLADKLPLAASSFVDTTLTRLYSRITESRYQ